jgi:Thioredoxin
MVSTVEALAKELAGVVRVGAVNCEREAALCQQHGVQGYPTVVAVVDGAVTPHKVSAKDRGERLCAHCGAAASVCKRGVSHVLY